MTYQKIFVALDHSPQSRFIFEQALEIAKQEKASLMLFHCLPLENYSITPYGNLYGQELANFSAAIREHIDKQVESVHEWLSFYCEKATAAGVPAQYDWKMGEASSWIREIANSWGADLIVLGRRGHQGLAELFLGSVSNHVVHHARCSVLVVQGIEVTED